METKTQGTEGTIAFLERLGFKTAAAELARMKEHKRKLALAYEHYRFVRQEKVAEFNKKLLKKTGQHMDDVRIMEYQTLQFERIEHYPNVPPQSVLSSLETAQNRKCFDYFEIASIRNVKDPILFGGIHGCSDRFYIDQWDTDVSIDDLLKANEG
jgi:hypothetical protein